MTPPADPAAREPLIAVVILHFRDVARTSACLERLFASDYAAFRVIVIDNSPELGQLPTLQQRFPDMIGQAALKNLGFAAGVNLGIGIAQQHDADAVLLLNNDALVERDTLSRLARCAAQSTIDILAPKFLDPRDSAQTVGTGFVIDAYDVRPIGWRESAEIDAGGVRARDAVSGAAMLIQRRVLDAIGGFDPAFFFYYEDIDFCKRARGAGFSVAAALDVVVYHGVSESTQRTPGLADYYLGYARQIYFRKYTSGWRRAAYMLHELQHALRWARVKWIKEHDAAAARGYLRGVVTAWLGFPLKTS
jgi:GT2 family glycosyltransferase